MFDTQISSWPTLEEQEMMMCMCKVVHDQGPKIMII